MSIRIALAGNPNSGKTTLFNALTGSNQSVGNWPGVTVAKKEGRLRTDKNVMVMDLPGIYSLSPYSPEEIISRNYLITERPDVILNIVDATNLERNLYLTTQLLELGIPVVIALNMMDAVDRSGDQIDTKQLGETLGCIVVEMSALRGTGVDEAARAAVEAVAQGAKPVSRPYFNGAVEHALAHIEERLLHDMPDLEQRFYAIKLFERDPKVLEKLKLSAEDRAHIEEDIKACEKELDDDAESIIIGQRYQYIEGLVAACCKKNLKKGLSVSQKVDRIVMNRVLAIPIFAVIMSLVYYLSVTTVGGWATDWANDGLFGDGYFLFGRGSEAYGEVSDSYGEAQMKADQFLLVAQRNGIDIEPLLEEEIDPIAESLFIAEASGLSEDVTVVDEESGEVVYEGPVTLEDWMAASDLEEPDPADYGTWVPGLPVILGGFFENASVAPWLEGLVMDGVVAGVGAVLGFVPQMLVLFLFLAFLEGCGYMARIAFILDKIFRRFGLSGKSIIPMLITTGCAVPGITASRTIESPRDRRMTVMTTTFVPCGAKLPIIALIAAAFFDGTWWVAPSAYFLGIAAILVSGAILKKTKMFRGEEAAFVMELPLYHLPTVVNVVKSMWERAWEFIRRAGTIILLASIFIWFTSNFGWVDGGFGMLDGEMEGSLLAAIGSAVAWIFAPLGFGTWQATVSTLLGLVAKEGVVSTMSILYGLGDGQGYAAIAGVFTLGAAYAFMVFNLLCAPCFAALGAIRVEMNSAKWFWFAVAYQTGFAYAVALCVYQFWKLATGGGFGLGTVAAILIVIGFIVLLFRPDSNGKTKTIEKVRERATA